MSEINIIILCNRVSRKLTINNHIEINQSTIDDDDFRLLERQRDDSAERRDIDLNINDPLCFRSISFAATIDSKVDSWAVNLAIDSNKYLATAHGKLLHDCQMRDEIIERE